jgi:hypothetical protein
MAKTENMTEHDIVVLLVTQREINAPWLEEQAIAIEDALESSCPDVLGPSVTANFEKNGWELDLTILATSTADAYDKLGRVFQVVEETAGIELGDSDPGEVRASYESSATTTDDHSGFLTPA